MASEEHAGSSYQLFMVGLAIVSIGAVGMQVTMPRDSPTRAVLAYADTVVCMLFFADFLWNLYRAESRFQYFTTWGWLDLISSIPVLDALRFSRLARVIRVLRLLRAAKEIAQFGLARRGQSALFAVSLLSIIAVTTAAIAVLQFEAGSGGTITDPESALWWAFVTITTVGYGDFYHITQGGRAVGMVLMLIGVGLFATLSGFFASWILDESTEAESSEIERLRLEMERLRIAIERKTNA